MFDTGTLCRSDCCTIEQISLPRDHHPEWVVIPPPNIVRLKSVTALRFFNHFRRQYDPHRVLINEHE
jgi:hypothetical protein